MNAHIRKVYVPMTETGFYILLCLGEENHGYGIIQRVEQLTGREIRLSPGTMYGSLSKMERDGLIEFVREEEKRRLYRLTALGRQVLELERLEGDRMAPEKLDGDMERSENPVCGEAGPQRAVDDGTPDAAATGSFLSEQEKS